MQAQINNTTTNNAIATVPVGKNDNVLIADTQYKKVVAKAQSVSDTIKSLVVERKSWENGAYKKSNEQLYALLGKCYELSFKLRGAEKEAKAARADFEELCEQKGYRFTESTHMLTKLVKYVFDGIDRRRVSAYSLVLRVALSENKLAADIPAFITNGGGVEEIRRRASPTAKTPKQKAALGKQALEGKEITVLRDAALTQLARQADSGIGDSVVAILTQQEDGSFIVQHLVTSKTVLNAALISAYSTSKAVVGKNDSAANESKLVDELLNEAVNG